MVEFPWGSCVERSFLPWTRRGIWFVQNEAGPAREMRTAGGGSCVDEGDALAAVLSALAAYPEALEAARAAIREIGEKEKKGK